MTNPNSIHSNLDKVDEYNNNRPLYKAKVKYFTKKYANQGLANIYNIKGWDFSCDEKELENFKKQVLKKKENKTIEDSLNYNEKNDKIIINIEFFYNEKQKIIIECGENANT